MQMRDAKGRFCRYSKTEINEEAKKEADDGYINVYGFKAFEHDLTCRGKQYVEFAMHSEGRAIPCECGLHFCLNPLDVFHFYNILSGQRIFSTGNPLKEILLGQVSGQVRQQDLNNCIRHAGTNSKLCTKRLYLNKVYSVENYLKIYCRRNMQLDQIGYCDRYTDTYTFKSYNIVAGCKRLVSTLPGADIITTSERIESAVPCTLLSKSTKPTVLELCESSVFNAQLGTIIRSSTYNQIPQLIVDGNKYKPNTWYRLALENGKLEAYLY